jgi:hypothetical protein
MAFPLSLTGVAALTRGANYNVGVKLKDVTSGDYLDLTGHSASVTISRTPNGEVLASLSYSISSELLVASLTASQTAALPYPSPNENGDRALFLKILVTRPDSVVIPGGEGYLEILP